MSYDLESLRKELISENLADDGLVGVVQEDHGGGFSGSLFAEKSTKKYTVSKLGTKLVIIPYNFEEIEYENAVGFDKSVVEDAKVSGDGVFLLSKLKIWTKDGKIHTYFLTQGRKEVKQILNLLGFDIKN